MTRAARWIGAFGLVLLGMALAGWIAALGEASGAAQRALAMAALSNSVLLALLALAGVVALGSPHPWLRLGLGSGRVRSVGVWLLAAGTLALSFAVDAALREAGLRETGALAEFDRAVQATRGLPLLVAVLALGVAPAIGEELLFRGLVQRGLEERFGALVAIPVASVLFAAVHGDPTHAAASFVLGLYLGLIAHLTGGIRASILCHAVNNLAAVLLGSWGRVSLPLEPLWILAALGLAGAAPLVARRRRVAISAPP